MFIYNICLYILDRFSILFCTLCWFILNLFLDQLQVQQLVTLNKQAILLQRHVWHTFLSKTAWTITMCWTKNPRCPNWSTPINSTPWKAERRARSSCASWAPDEFEFRLPRPTNFTVPSGESGRPQWALHLHKVVQNRLIWWINKSRSCYGLNGLDFCHAAYYFPEMMCMSATLPHNKSQLMDSNCLKHCGQEFVSIQHHLDVASSNSKKPPNSKLRTFWHHRSWQVPVSDPCLIGLENSRSDSPGGPTLND